VMEDDSALEDLSLLPRGTTIPRGQTWAGSPPHAGAGDKFQGSRGTDNIENRLAEDKSAPSPVSGAAGRPSVLRRFAFGFLHALGLLLFPVLVVSALFPGIMLMNHLNYLD